MKSIEVQLQEANAKITALETENGQLKESITKGKIETAKAERAKLFAEAKLPQPCINRLEEAFKASTDNAGLKEAINVEAEYVKSLQGTVRKHNGAGDNGTGNISEAEQKVDEFKERQYNAYVKGGMSEADASRMSGFKPKK